MRTCIAFMLIACMVLTAGSQAYAKSGLVSGEDAYPEPSRSLHGMPDNRPSLFSDDDDYAENPDLVVNRPVNVQGLTGLILTNSAYTQAKGSIVVGASTVMEHSKLPNYTILQGIATLTAGVMDRLEVGARAKMITTEIGSSSRKSGAGDTDLMVKWRVSSQGEIMPAFALGVAYTLPTGERSKDLSEVQHEAIRLMILGSSEKELPNGPLLGIYGDLQLVFIDQIGGRHSTPYSDKYGQFNGGVLIPLTTSRQFQAIAEYTKVFKKDKTTVTEKDYSAVMPGLRFVTPKLNISLGVQFLSKDQANVEDDQRYIATMSYKF